MSEPLTSFQRAERLFIAAEKLGCDTPTENMIADAIQDAEFDTLHNPRIIAERHDQNLTSVSKAWTALTAVGASSANTPETELPQSDKEWTDDMRWVHTSGEISWEQDGHKTAPIAKVAPEAASKICAEFNRFFPSIIERHNQSVSSLRARIKEQVNICELSDEYIMRTPEGAKRFVESLELKEREQA